MQRNVFYLWRFGWLLFFFAGCDIHKPENEPSPSSFSTNELLQTHIDSFAPKREWLDQDDIASMVASASRLLVAFQHKTKGKRFTLYRKEQNWWARKKRHEIEFGTPLKEYLIQDVLDIFRNIRLSKQVHIRLERETIQILVFSEKGQFVMRLMKAHAPDQTQASWFAYYKGKLFSVESNLDARMKKLYSIFTRLTKYAKWIRFPLNASNLDFSTSQNIAVAIEEKRKQLRRCFKKRKFPRQIGPLRMHLTFANTGKVKALRIESNAHKKYSVVWCVWWFVKKWKLRPFGVSEVEYKLSIPPGGP